jgi:hypothetical protein
MGLSLVQSNAFSRSHVRAVLNSTDLDPSKKAVLTAILRYCGRAREEENVASHRLHVLERKINAAKKEARTAELPPLVRADLASNEAKLMEARLVQEKAKAGTAETQKVLNAFLSSCNGEEARRMFSKAMNLQAKTEEQYEAVRKRAYVAGVVVGALVIAACHAAEGAFSSMAGYFGFPGFVAAVAAGVATIELVSKTALDNAGKAFSLDRTLRQPRDIDSAEIEAAGPREKRILILQDAALEL